MTWFDILLDYANRQLFAQMESKKQIEETICREAEECKKRNGGYYDGLG